MPAYELSILLRHLQKPQLAEILKRVGTLLLNEGVVLEKLENHGTKDLPYNVLHQEEFITKGCYFVYKFQTSPTLLAKITEECMRDSSLMRCLICKQPEDFKFECTLEEELNPPSKRESVKQLLEEGVKARELKRRRERYRKRVNWNYYDIYM